MKPNDQRLRDLGAAIAERREAAGLSQAELARRLGHASHAHLSRVEAGRKAPSLALVTDIADALGVAVRDLVDF